MLETLLNILVWDLPQLTEHKISEDLKLFYACRHDSRVEAASPKLTESEIKEAQAPEQVAAADMSTLSCAARKLCRLVLLASLCFPNTFFPAPFLNLGRQTCLLCILVNLAMLFPSVLCVFCSQKQYHVSNYAMC